MGYVYVSEAIISWLCFPSFKNHPISWASNGWRLSLCLKLKKRATLAAWHTKQCFYYIGRTPWLTSNINIFLESCLYAPNLNILRLSMLMGYSSATWNIIEPSIFYSAKMNKIDYLLFAILSDIYKLDLAEENEVWFTCTFTSVIFLRGKKDRIWQSQIVL